MNTENKPVVIGAGPAGVSTSLFLSQFKIPHVIMDKAVFPRDKICGDAVSGKVLDILARYDGNIREKFNDMTGQMLPAHGITFFAPNGNKIDVPFPKSKPGEVPGFLTRRTEFDNIIFNMLKTPYAEIWQGSELLDVEKANGHLRLILLKDGNRQEITTKIAIGAEGQRSVLARKLTGFRVEENHFCAGLRAYYKNVDGLHPLNFLELHFMNDLLPGYFWIFPLPGGWANVGLGMLSKDVSRNKVNLRKELERIVTTHPVISKRFSNAVPGGKVMGWGLPLGSRKRPLSGDHFLLTGDAASLIDPFTGEGIGNAFVSGLIAARTVAKAIEANDFSSGMLKRHDKELYNKLWKELKLSHRLQQLSSYPYLFNFVVNKAASSKQIQDLLTFMFTDLEVRAKMKNPLFYLKLLFNKKQD